MPTPIGAWQGGLGTVVVHFESPVTTAAETASNWTLVRDDGATMQVMSAIVNSDRLRVTLYTTTHIIGRWYAVTAAGAITGGSAVRRTYKANVMIPGPLGLGLWGTANFCHALDVGGGYAYYAYIDLIGQVRVARWTLATGDITYSAVLYTVMTGTPDPWGVHSGPHVLIDPTDNRIVVIKSGYSTSYPSGDYQGTLWKSATAYALDFGGGSQLPPGSANHSNTYNRPVFLPNGTLIIIADHQLGTPAQTGVYRYIGNGSSQSAGTLVSGSWQTLFSHGSNGSGNYYNLYFGQPVTRTFSGTTRVAVAGTLYRPPDTVVTGAAADWGILYMYSDDAGATWRMANGTAITVGSDPNALNSNATYWPLRASALREPQVALSATGVPTVIGRPTTTSGNTITAGGLRAFDWSGSAWTTYDFDLATDGDPPYLDTNFSMLYVGSDLHLFSSRDITANNDGGRPISRLHWDVRTGSTWAEQPFASVAAEGYNSKIIPKAALTSDNRLVVTWVRARTTFEGDPDNEPGTITGEILLDSNSQVQRNVEAPNLFQVQRTLTAQSLAYWGISMGGVSLPPAPTGGFVTFEGTQLLDEENQPLYLNGVNNGGHLVWEGWIWGGGLHGETSLWTNLADVVGTTRANELRDQVRAQWFTQADWNQVAALGFNHVRLPLHYRIFQELTDPIGTYKASGWTLLDAQMTYAENAGVYVIPDLHAPPGSQNSQEVISDYNGGDNMWSNTSAGDDFKARTIALWRAIAARYSTRSIVAGWDLLNEPWAVGGEAELGQLYEDIIAAIRQVDTNHIIWIEGNTFAHDFNQPMKDAAQSDPIGLTAFEFHQYPTETNPDTKLADRIAAAQAINVPLWCGEYGALANGYSTGVAQVNRFNAAGNGICGRCLWTWKTTGVEGLLTVPVTSAQTKLINYMASTSNPKPTVPEAEQGWADLLSNGANATPVQQLVDLYLTTSGTVSLPSASVVDRVDAGFTTNVATYTTASFTPTKDDLLWAIWGISDSSATDWVVTDSLGGTWSKVTRAVKRTSIDFQELWVRDSVIGFPSAMTVTISHASGNATGAAYVIGAATGVTKTGTSAVRQFVVADNRTNAAPTTTFAAPTLTTNSIISSANSTQALPGAGVPSGFAVLATSAYSTPSNGVRIASKDNSLATSTVTWAGTITQDHCVIAAEFDSST